MGNRQRQSIIGGNTGGNTGILDSINRLYVISGESSELREVLRNPELRRYLRHIDTTHNPRGFMKLAMQGRRWTMFSAVMRSHVKH